MEPEETLAEKLSAPLTASNQQDLTASKFCLHISIFPVDTPAPFCLRRRLGASTEPLDGLLLTSPGSREGGQGSIVTSGRGVSLETWEC